MSPANNARALSASGLTISPLGMGTNKWTMGKNDEGVLRAFNAALDAGVSFFDTAEIYGFGKSEQLLGACLARSERPAVIASKFLPLPTRRLGKALDASLSRLGLRSLDLYYIHFPLGRNIDALMDQMAREVQKGKVRAVGVSNFSAAQMRRAAQRLARHGIPLAANEVRYNLRHREPEVNGILDACHELDVALVAYVPLASGGLTSQISPQTSTQLPTARPSDEGHVELREVLRAIAEQRGKSVSQVAWNWLLRRDEHVIPIPGATSDAHAADNAGALGWELDDEEFAAIDQASSPAQR